VISALGLQAWFLQDIFIWLKYIYIHISEVQLPQMILKIEFLLDIHGSVHHSTILTE